jgi:hypothetical protein
MASSKLQTGEVLGEDGESLSDQMIMAMILDRAEKVSSISQGETAHTEVMTEDELENAEQRICQHQHPVDCSGATDPDVFTQARTAVASIEAAMAERPGSRAHHTTWRADPKGRGGTTFEGRLLTAARPTDDPPSDDPTALSPARPTVEESCWATALESEMLDPTVDR